MSGQTCILTAKDFTIVEVMHERSLGTDDVMRRLLRQKLETATVVFHDDVPPDVATLNSRVEFRVNDGKPDSRILSQDARGLPTDLALSIATPRGLALLGLRQGQEICVGVDEEGEERISLEAVLFQPEAARREREAGARLAAASARPRPSLRVIAGDAPEHPRPSPGAWRHYPDDDDPGPSAA